MKKVIGSAAVLSALLLLSGCGTPAANPNGTAGTPPTTMPSGSSGAQQPSVSDTNAVNIQNFAFSPATLTVKKGATVTWTNNDSVTHTIKSTSFNSGSLAKGSTFKFIFDSAGTFDYSCGIHPSMLGKIIVE